MISAHRKRPLPTATELAARADFLAGLAGIPIPLHAESEQAPKLEPGNSKIGTRGKFAQTMFVWNLPAMATCPGASLWCSKHCYNGDSRVEKFPVASWTENWAWAIYKTSALRDAIVSQIVVAPAPVSVRIHSSGDFYSGSYVRLWIEIAEATPEVRYWAYTRSWTDESLLPELQRLHESKNVELFASWDATMPRPPANWRLSIVGGATQDKIIEGHGLTCPEQDGRLPDCANCAYCFTRRDGDVIFDVH